MPCHLSLKKVKPVFLSTNSSSTENLVNRFSCGRVSVDLKPRHLKNELDSMLKKNQGRLWLKHRHDSYEHYFCYDENHKISSRDTLYFGRTISIKKLKFVSKLMPSLKVLQLDPLDQVYRENDNLYNLFTKDIEGLDYRDKKGKAVPITKIFPQVACLILPGQTEIGNFVGDLSQVKHLTLFDKVKKGTPTFPNLDSLEVRRYSIYYKRHSPMPHKIVFEPYFRIFPA